MRVNVVFQKIADDEPDLVFVEVETLDGKSIKVGEWKEIDSDLRALELNLVETGRMLTPDQAREFANSVMMKAEILRTIPTWCYEKALEEILAGRPGPDEETRGVQIEAIQPIIHEAIVQAGSGWTPDFEKQVARDIVEKLGS